MVNLPPVFANRAPPAAQSRENAPLFLERTRMKEEPAVSFQRGKSTNNLRINYRNNLGRNRGLSPMLTR